MPQGFAITSIRSLYVWSNGRTGLAKCCPQLISKSTSHRTESGAAQNFMQEQGSESNA